MNRNVSTIRKTIIALLSIICLFTFFSIPSMVEDEPKTSYSENAATVQTLSFVEEALETEDMIMYERYLNSFLKGKEIYDAVEFSIQTYQNQYVEFSKEDFEEFQIATNILIQEIMDTSVSQETVNRYNNAIRNVPSSSESTLELGELDIKTLKDAISYSSYATVVFELNMNGKISDYEFQKWQNSQIVILDNLSHDSITEGIEITKSFISKHQVGNINIPYFYFNS